MISKKITKADNVNYKDKSETSVDVLILAYFVYRSKNTIIDKIFDRFKILSIGYNARFIDMSEEWKRENDYQGKVITQIYTPDETNILSVINCANQLKKFVEAKAKEPLINKVDVKLFIPINNFNSLNVLFTRYLFGQLDCSQDTKIWESILGKKIIIKNINSIDYSEMPLTGINIPVEYRTKIIEEDNCIPTSKDARVAAVLCEYTYLLVRDYNNFHKTGNKRLGKYLKREQSDKKRQEETLNEVLELSIIPDKWKVLEERWKEQKKKIKLANDDSAETIIEELGLKEWDAISFDFCNEKNNPQWMGLTQDHGIDWNNSLSKKIVDSLEKNFSLIGNRGVLNTWFGISRNSGFASVIYVNEKSRTIMYCTAGSDFGKDMFFNGDWVTTNISQFFTGLSPQYQQSVTNAKILNDIISKIEKEDKRPIKLLFIGHSLGGGLASNNAIVTSNRHAITFNAAGLNWLRVPISLAINKPSQLLHPFTRRERVHLFVIKGEILDLTQSVISPTPWLLNGLNLDLPGKARAYSSPLTRKEIEAPFINGKQPSSLDRHSLINFMIPASKIKEIKI